jgi:hypothetical protein
VILYAKLTDWRLLLIVLLNYRREKDRLTRDGDDGDFDDVDFESMKLTGIRQ